MAKTTSADVIHAVAAERRHAGKATVRGVAARLGLSTGAAHQRMRQLVADGILESDGTAGSYRLASSGPVLRVALDLTLDAESGRVVDVTLAEA